MWAFYHATRPRSCPAVAYAFGVSGAAGPLAGYPRSMLKREAQMLLTSESHSPVRKRLLATSPHPLHHFGARDFTTLLSILLDFS
jgi:hypothetical protein